MRLVINPVRTEHLNIYTEGSTVYIKGVIDMQFPKDYLNPFFASLHEALLTYGFRHVTLDITELFFINSSGIRELLLWIMNIHKLKKEEKYEIFLVIDPDVTCQNSMAKSFTLMYPGLKTIIRKSCKIKNNFEEGYL